VRLTALENETANIEAWTASVNQIADNGIVQGTSTRLHFSGLVSASIVPNVNGPIASIFIEQDGTKLNTASFNQYTASTTADLDSIHQTTQSLNNFTASLTTAFVSTASFNAYTQSINSYTASNNDKWNILGSQSGSWVTETESGSFLITASFDNGTRNLTFTKGDASTFAVNIPDVSGSAGNFVTTSSFNAYTASTNQRVSSLESNSASVNTSITQLNASSASQQVSINALNAATASYVTETESGSFLITASFDNGTRNLTFTKGDTTTFAVNIPDVSGSGTINTGSFATTGSNSFIGNQNVAGRVIISGSSALTNNNYLMFTRDGGNEIFRVGVSDNGQTYDFVVTGSTNQQLWLIDNQGGTYINTFQAPIIATNNVRLESGFTASLQEGYAWVGNSAGKNAQVATSSFGGGSIPAGTISGSAQITALGFVSSSVTASSLITASVSLNTITFTKGDNTTFNITVDTGSGGGGGGGQTFANPSVESISGSLVLSALTFNSGAANLLHLSASAQNQANLVFKNNNLTSTTQVSGSNNIFVNPTAPTTNFTRFVGGFGNIYMNSGSVPQITASAASVSGNRPTMNNNIIPSNITWNINQASNPGAHIYSNNILENGTMNFNTTGNTGAVTFSNNIGLIPTIGLNAPSASVANVLAGVSGSNAVSITSNVLTQGTIQYFGPVSSSTHAIQQNVIGGTLTMNVQSGSRGYTVSNNTMNGSLTINDQVVNGPTVGSTNAIQQNSINGAVTVTNRASASVAMTANSLGGFTITNDYDSMTNGTVGRTFNINGNTLLGFIANNIYFSGSAAGTGTTNDRGRGLYGNVIGGSRISASVIGDGNRHLLASAIIGQGLNIYGTSLYDASNAANAGGQNGGSAFFGRWNAEDGNRALSAQTVFAVGTGTSGSTGIVRKTGFLIDSGSNSFFEGTLNVSGSTILSGSTFISNLQNGVTADVVTYDTTTGELRKASLAAITSASFDAAEFWSTTTQSGSAGVSGSITFNNSGSVAGVSVVNNSQVTLSQAGTYNVQFSAQIETSAGADTVHIWFKKNGNNISDSASKVVLANNTAQIMTVNILDEAVANDYYQLAYQTTNGNATILYEPASGNIPAIPSVILTVTQIR